jgi:hypothetical protein
MRKLLTTSALIGALAISGCADSGPVPIGPDSYMMANTGTWAWSSGAALVGDLYHQANAFCASQGKQIMTMAHHSNDSGMGFDKPFAHGELEFRCLSAGDPDLHRPYRQPNVIVEQQNVDHNDEPRE